MGRYGKDSEDHDYRDMDYRGYRQDRAAPDGGFSQDNGLIEDRQFRRENSMESLQDFPAAPFTENRAAFRQKGVRGGDSNRSGKGFQQMPSRFKQDERQHQFETEHESDRQDCQPFKQIQADKHIQRQTEGKEEWGRRGNRQSASSQEHHSSGWSMEEEKYCRGLGPRKVCP